MKGLFGCVNTFGWLVVVAWRSLVDELLEDGSVKHSKTGNDETEGDTLDWREVNIPTAEEGVDTEVQDGDHDDNGDGVQVLDEIVRSAIESHRGSDSSQVSVNLRVA